jgi:hypothetical protein
MVTKSVDNIKQDLYGASVHPDYRIFFRFFKVILNVPVLVRRLFFDLSVSRRTVTGFHISFNAGYIASHRNGCIQGWFRKRIRINPDAKIPDARSPKTVLSLKVVLFIVFPPLKLLCLPIGSGSAVLVTSQSVPRAHRSELCGEAFYLVDI